MARKISRSPAKRANRPNPRSERNMFDEENAPEFISGKRKRKPFNQNIEQNAPRTNKVEIIPRNIAQEDYLDALDNEDYTVVFGIGSAGTGKSWMAVMHAIQQLQEGKIKKIVISRPVTTADGSNLGALPGGICEKMAPYLGAILDALKEVYPVKLLNKMLEDEIVQVIPISVMRGRSIKNAIIIMDEAQDTDVHVMKMILTRIGEGSRMYITGDLKQADRGFMGKNGLQDFTTRLENYGGSEFFKICRFGIDDVVRHPAVEEALKIYGEED